MLNHSGTIVNHQIPIINMGGHSVMASGLHTGTCWSWTISCSQAGADFLSAQTGAGVSLNTSPWTGVTGLHDWSGSNLHPGWIPKHWPRVEAGLPRSFWRLNVVQMSCVLMWEEHHCWSQPAVKRSRSWNQRLASRTERLLRLHHGHYYYDRFALALRGLGWAAALLPKLLQETLDAHNTNENFV